MKHLKKWISILLVLSLLLPVLPQHIHAVETSDDEIIVYEILPSIYTPPLFSDSAAPEFVEVEPSEGIVTFADENDYLTDLDEITDLVRETMKARESQITLYVKVSADTDGNTAYNEVYDKVIAGCFAHTGVPTEGDYIAFQHNGINGGGSIYTRGGYHYMTMNFRMAYRTTAAQEAELDQEVAAIVANINAQGLDDYEKIYAVHKLMGEQIAYDYEHLGHPNYPLMFTAYAAWINKTSVCQGYALLFYRLMLELGVDNRIITGKGNGGDHAWNIVRLGGKYYNIDTTWDATGKGYVYHNYFLRADSTFGDHLRDSEYATADYYARYPMASSDYIPGTSETVSVTGVQLDRDTLTLKTNESRQLTATVTPDNASNGSVVFTSSDPNVARVNQNTGVVTGVGIGTATITVTTVDGGFTDSCTVTVSCNHIFNDQIEEDAYIVPETANNCQTMKEYYYACSLCGAMGTETWIGRSRGDHVVDQTKWEANGEEGHWHPCENCKEGTGLEPHTPNIDQPTAEQDKLCTVCGYVILPRLDPDHVVAEGLWDGGPVKWKITADGTLTISGNRSIQSSLNYIWKDYSRLITRIVVEDGITKIPNDAFSGMTNVTSVYLGNKLQTIGTEAFQGCTGLTHAEFPASVTAIGSSAFNGCSALESISFASGSKLNTIHGGAFERTALKELTTPDSLRTIGAYTFRNCTKLESIHLNDGFEDLQFEAFSGCTNLKNVYIPASVKEIGKNVFEECMALEHFEYYGSAMLEPLRGREQLKTAIIAGNAAYLGTSFFAGCSALKDVTLGNKIEVISSDCFYGCSALEELVIPDSVWLIEGSAFSCATALKKLEIPASVTRIDGFAFQGSGIQELTFLGDAPEFDSNCFYELTATCYYPGDNATWTAGVLKPYGGNISWVPIGGTHEHSYQENVVAPTCTEEGYTEYVCACGARYQDNVVPATGHSFLDWFEDVAATCSYEGLMRRNCSNCSFSETESIPKLDHDYEITETPPTCISAGFIEYRCRICGHYDIIGGASVTGIHTYDDDYDAECNVCGHVRNLHPIDDFVLPFTQEEWENLKSFNEFCIEAYLPPATAFPGLQEAARIRARELNELYQPYRPDGSDSTTVFEELDIPMRNAVEICLNFDHTSGGWFNFLVEEVYDYILSHYAFSGYNGKYALEMIDGSQNSGNVCSYSDLYIVVPDDLVVREGMSVSDMGLIALVNCDIHGTCYLPVLDAYCDGYQYGDPTLTVNLYDMSRTVNISYEDCTHDWSWADCTVAETCGLCGEVRKAAEHEFSGWVVKESPDCVAPGTDIRECIHCKHQETRETAALGHSFTNYVSNGDATCTADGTKTAKCDRCDATDTVADTGSAKGHTGGEATCNSAAICTVCGTAYGDKNPANHAGGTEIRGAVEATEFADGYTGDTHCKGCGELLSKGSVIPATHTHSYGQWQSDAAEHWHECSCGSVTDKAAHVPGPTATETAPQVCTVCGYELSPILDVHTHTLTKVDGKKATHDAQGVAEHYTCSCGKLFADAEGKEEIEDQTSVVLPVLPDMYGDVNHDGRINVTDAVMVMKHRANALTEDDFFCEHCANVDTNPKINVSDAVLIMKKRANKDMMFPIQMQ